MSINTLVGKFGGFAGVGGGPKGFKFLLFGGWSSAGITQPPSAINDTGGHDFYGGVVEYNIDISTAPGPVSLIYNHRTMEGGFSNGGPPIGDQDAGDGIFLSTAPALSLPAWPARSNPVPEPGFGPTIIAAAAGAGGVGGSTGGTNHHFGGAGGGGGPSSNRPGEPGIQSPANPLPSPGGTGAPPGPFLVGGGANGVTFPNFTGGGGGGGYYGGNAGGSQPGTGGAGGGGSGFVSTTYTYYHSSGPGPLPTVTPPTGGGRGAGYYLNWTRSDGVYMSSNNPTSTPPANMASKIWLAVVPIDQLSEPAHSHLELYEQLDGYNTTTTKTITMSIDGSYTIT